MNTYYFERIDTTNKEPTEVLALQFDTDEEAKGFAEASTEAWKNMGAPFKLELME